MDGLITASGARVVQRLVGMPASACACGRLPDAGHGHQPKDRQLLAMDHGFSRTGGIACGDEVARMLREHSDQPVSMLAHWIVGRTVVSFEWQSRVLLPLFQFDLSDMSLRIGVIEVIRELSNTFDDWDLASWFVQPNCWLRDIAPVDTIFADPLAVLHAARTDRFIRRG